ncbi:hypothetical protein [Kitasatospora sp. NPDC059827]|uniref:hypothetical protein n=1 Tax=Kitasatospora sp. NPDC059827 TaxID=3346964 RepID=UPI003655865C
MFGTPCRPCSAELIRRLPRWWRAGARRPRRGGGATPYAALARTDHDHDEGEEGALLGDLCIRVRRRAAGMTRENLQ